MSKQEFSPESVRQYLHALAHYAYANPSRAGDVIAQAADCGRELELWRVGQIIKMCVHSTTDANAMLHNITTLVLSKIPPAEAEQMLRASGGEIIKRN